MKITKTRYDDYITVEISDGIVSCGGYTLYNIELGGKGETEQEAIENLQKNLRNLEANIIPEIKKEIGYGSY